MMEVVLCAVDGEVDGPIIKGVPGLVLSWSGHFETPLGRHSALTSCPSEHACLSRVDPDLHPVISSHIQVLQSQIKVLKVSNLVPVAIKSNIDQTCGFPLEHPLNELVAMM